MLGRPGWQSEKTGRRSEPRTRGRGGARRGARMGVGGASGRSPRGWILFGEFAFDRRRKGHEARSLWLSYSPGHSVNILTDERLCARHPGAASMQLHGTARHCRLLCQSLRALKSCVPLAPSQPHPVAGRCPNMWELVRAVLGKFVKRKKKAGSAKTPPLPFTGLTSR